MLGHVSSQDHVNDGGTHGSVLCPVRGGEGRKGQVRDSESRGDGWWEAAQW